MSDLISRKALIKAMEKKYGVANETGMYPTGLSEAFIITEKIIQEQPIAYDVDKVVEELTAKGIEVGAKEIYQVIKLGDVIEIVKGAIGSE